MRLFLDGSDIAHLTLASQESSEPWDIQEYQCAPEEYLKKIDEYIKSKGKSTKDIFAISIVTGPGSATALRMSLAIVDTWHFVLGTPMIPHEKVAGELIVDYLNTWSRQGDENGEYKKFLYPIYSRDPQITTSTKDSLKRPIN
ncbi:MAG: hypothetical protein WC730_03980 [Patescibacteria group bacterium]|jgi:hypothetical protein